MIRMISARMLRVLLVTCGSAVVFLVVMSAAILVRGARQLVVLLPFLTVALAVVGLGLVLPRIDQVVERLIGHREVTAYSALTEAAARVSGGSLEQPLPGLAEVVTRQRPRERAANRRSSSAPTCTPATCTPTTPSPPGRPAREPAATRPGTPALRGRDVTTGVAIG